MRHTRSIVVAGGVLATGALVGWIVVTLLTIVFHQVPDDTEQVGTPADQFDGKAEPDIYGVVKSVDAAHGRIALGIPIDDGKEQEQHYNLAQGATVLLDGPATLNELVTNTRVALKFETGGKEVAAIRSEPFRITVALKQHEVEVGKFFHVVKRVTNASPTPQSFWVWGGSQGMHWGSSNPDVVDDPNRGNSFHNQPMLVTLAPTEAYENTHSAKVMVVGRVSFQMGFTPLTECTNDGRPTLIRLFDRFFAASKRTFWSGEVTLQVNPSSEKQ